MKNLARPRVSAGKAAVGASRLAAVAAILLLLSNASIGQTKTRGTILRYDENGRVTGRDEQMEEGGERIDRKPGYLPDGAVDPGGSTRFDAGQSGFEEGEILVLGGADLSQRARALGFTVMDRASLVALELEILRLRTPLAARTEDALKVFRTAFPGAVADVNAHVRPAARSRRWDAAGTVGWPEAPVRCGRDITIGMIDTPVDAAHQAFLGRDIRYRSFLKENLAPADPHHGTAVAALLVGNPDSNGFAGLLPEATLVAAGIFERRPTGQTVGNVYALLKALDWMAEERVRVVNLSLETSENAVLSKALDRSLRGGRILIAAAGNGGAGARPAFPAAHPRVLAVTAIDPGLEPYAYANHGNHIDFAAPGVSLWTAVPGGGRFQSGTSFAAPFLTAVAALQVRAGIEPNAEAIRESLARSARDLGAPGKDDVFGWGLLSFTPSCG